MDLARYFSTRRKEEAYHHHHHHHHNSSHVKSQLKNYIPLLANPINEDVRELLSGSLADLEKLNGTPGTVGSSSDTTTLAGDGKKSRGNVVIYKQHHEASTVELFYDLFFVANLAYFTAMHQHTDAQSLINYLKLFSLLWFTWLNTTLFDVRFSIDCVWNRFHKAIQFGVFTGFVFAGPVFDMYSNNHDALSYRNFAIVLVVSRLAIALQYAVVMWQGRMFRQTLVPLGLSVMVHSVAAVIYGIMIAVFPRGQIGLEEQIVWVVVSIVEGLSIFLIAIFWRILSFKYTHLVERLQLLTLIIIGEGIIGLVKSVACLFKGQTSNNATEVGTVVAAVLILYLLYMLYFDQLSHDRFGTVRQQIWSLLHYPLHMAILLCVEGNTSLIVWNTAVQVLKHIWSLAPKDYADPGAGFEDTNAFIGNLNQSMWTIDARFDSKYWNATYKWQSNLTAIANYSATYGFRSDEWNNKTGNLVRSMFDYAQVFVFEAHSDTLGKLNAVSAPTSSPRQQLDRVYSVFDTAVIQFYVGAGTVLLVLALMYWFNKLHKTKYEFGEMINRVVFGFALVIASVSAVIGNKTTGGFKFAASEWIIPIVVLLFVAVLMMDNILLALSHHTSRRRGNSWGTSTPNPDDDINGLISRYQTRTPRSDPSSAPLSQVQSAYVPYDSPPMDRESMASRVRFDVPHRRTESPDSIITVQDENERNAANFSYQNTPVDPAAVGLGIRRAVSPVDQERLGKKSIKKGGYESVGGAQAHTYDGQEYGQRSRRVEEA